RAGVSFTAIRLLARSISKKTLSVLCCLLSYFALFYWVLERLVFKMLYSIPPDASGSLLN
ncbi:MAG: hypothetical protein ACOYM7_10705, partial [Paludibacter sp.]